MKNRIIGTLLRLRFVLGTMIGLPIAIIVALVTIALYLPLTVAKYVLFGEEYK
jgi:hypothetical protein